MGAWRKSFPFRVATVAPSATACASISESHNACGWRLTSGECLSFPQARAADAPRAYTRKGLLRKEMEDIEYGDDEVEDEEPHNGWSETGELDSRRREVEVEPDDESFD